METGGRYANGYGNGYGDDAAQGRTCTQAVGAQRANQLVQQCTQVSPATHPPCNAPGFCDEYR